MWLFCDEGFLSVVEKPWDKAEGTLTVRARVRADLERFLVRAAPVSAAIREDVNADYPFRAQVPRKAVERFMTRTVAALHYDNFKAQVGRLSLAREEPPGERASIYGKVWALLFSLTIMAAGGLERLRRPAARYLEEEEDALGF